METYLAAPFLCWIEVKGSDARKFLNGTLTQDIQKLQGDIGCYALMLAPKGKIIADCYCYTCGNWFGIVCTQNLKQKILENLEKYIIFQKVEVVDQSEKWGAIQILGPKAKDHLHPILKGLPVETFSYSEVFWDGLQLYVIYKKQWGLPCYELWTYKEKNPELKAKLNLPEIPKETQETLRIESATPLYGVDYDENTIPQEACLYHALSFEKGCYVGQEIVTRLEHRGHVGKQLVQLFLETKNPPTVGERIFSLEDKEIGRVTSSCFSTKHQRAIALGYIQYASLDLQTAKVQGVPARIKKLVN